MTTDPTITAAAAIVRELTGAGLTASEICKLAGLPGRQATIRALNDSHPKALKPDVLPALQAGQERYRTDPDPLAWRRPSRTRADDPGRLDSDSAPQPRMLDSRSRLAKRLAEKNREDRAA